MALESYAIQLVIFYSSKKKFKLESSLIVLKSSPIKLVICLIQFESSLIQLESSLIKLESSPNAYGVLHSS